MNALVVIPTYNERDNLPSMVERIVSQGSFDVLVVDDNSPDGTGLLAEGLKDKYPGRVAVLHRPGKLGLGTAYRLGFAYALGKPYEYIFQMDADFSHRPEDLPKLLDALQDGADVALGSRYVPGGKTMGRSVWREMISRGGSRYAGLVLGLPYKDLTGGFKGYRRSALQKLNLSGIQSNGFGFQIETTYQMIGRGLKVVEVPIEFAERRAGKSKMSSKIFLEASLLVWRLRMSHIRNHSRWAVISRLRSKRRAQV